VPASRPVARRDADQLIGLGDKGATRSRPPSSAFSASVRGEDLDYDGAAEPSGHLNRRARGPPHRRRRADSRSPVGSQPPEAPDRRPGRLVAPLGATAVAGARPGRTRRRSRSRRCFGSRTPIDAAAVTSRSWLRMSYGTAGWGLGRSLRKGDSVRPDRRDGVGGEASWPLHLQRFADTSRAERKAARAPAVTRALARAPAHYWRT
jgi:hypothetical protein